MIGNCRNCIFGRLLLSFPRGILADLWSPLRQVCGFTRTLAILFIFLAWLSLCDWSYFLSYASKCSKYNRSLCGRCSGSFLRTPGFHSCYERILMTAAICSTRGWKGRRKDSLRHHETHFCTMQPVLSHGFSCRCDRSAAQRNVVTKFYEHLARK